MSTVDPSGGPAAPEPARRPRGSWRRGRIVAAAVSAGAVVALTTVIALNEGRASGTPASGSSAGSSAGSSSSGTDSGNGIRPANPPSNGNFGDGFGDTGSGTGNAGGFTPHTRSGGS